MTDAATERIYKPKRKGPPTNWWTFPFHVVLGFCFYLGFCGIPLSLITRSGMANA